MDGFLIIGAGKIGMVAYEEVAAGEYQAAGVEWLEFPLIAVTTSGVIMYLDEDGSQHVSPPGPEVKITDVEWSAFSLLTDLAAQKSEPTCTYCKDDPSALMPPVCPKCFAGSKKRRVQ